MNSLHLKIAHEIILMQLACFILSVYFSVRVDQDGVICQQEGVFRVNCMDCLDRTNVVQAAVARVVMEHQVRKRACKSHSTF